MLAPGDKPLAPQHSNQHACASKRMFHMKFVDATHQCQIGVADRTQQIIDARATDAEQLGLPAHRQHVRAVYHFFPLSRPALPSAPDKT